MQEEIRHINVASLHGLHRADRRDMVAMGLSAECGEI